MRKHRRWMRGVILIESESMSRMPLPLQWFWVDDRGLSVFLTILALVTFVLFPLAGMSLLSRFLMDLVVHPVARSLAVCEGFVGQLYPAILIAGLVGMAWPSRMRH